MHLVQEIGSYAGFAAVVGLAVLSALYFSQARDVKRLREWAGRAPERAAEEEARVSAAAQAQAQAQQRAAAAVAGGATVVRPPQPQPQGSAATAANPPPSGVPAPPPPTLPSARPTPAGAGAPSTPILSGMRPKEPWYRRIHWPAPRYIALIVVGILVLGAGAAYGVSQLTSDSGTSNGNSGQVVPQSNSQSGGGSKSKKSHKPAALDRGKITVAVLNGTTVTGLAATTADKIEQAGFKRGTTDNALTQGQQAESVVEYAKGNSAAASQVARLLGIGQTEPIDSETQGRAGDATVTVIIGADLAGGGSSSG